MSGAVRIRDADLSRDRPSFVGFIMGSQLFEHAFEPNRRLDPPVAEEHLVKMLDAVATRPGRIFVAEDDEATLGWGIVFEMQDDVYVVAAERRAAFIAELFVAEAARGRGVGRALIAACEAWALGRGIGVMHMGVLPGNTRARAIYDTAGYAAYSLQLRKYL
ncbi:MAG: GNAT family N-acetyltransferase [Rhizomicrobium sp.]